MVSCQHRAGWTRVGGMLRCEACGTRRFTDYAAMRPPGLPHAVARSGPARRAADRNAARAVWEAMGRARQGVRGGASCRQCSRVGSRPES